MQFWKEHCSDDAFLNFFEALLVGKAPKFERVDGHEKLMHAGAKTMWEKISCCVSLSGLLVRFKTIIDSTN